MVLGERYVIGEEIGHGGMAVVHRARDQRLGRDVAIKLLKTDPPPTPEVLALFRQEAQATSKLTHPHIVHLHDFGELPDGRLFLVMELLRGCTLGQLLDRFRATGEAMPWARASNIALQICDALTVAHAHKILHRDMTPANCFLVDDMRRDHVKILDFGISRIRENTQTVTINRGTQEPLMGTPYYMAPEVLQGKRGDHRVDVYAVGVLLYEMTTCARPFTAQNLFVLLRAVAEGTFEPPRRCNPKADLDDAREAVILRAMASDPAARYGSAAELADALEALQRRPPRGPDVSSSRTRLPPADPLGQTQPAVRRRPRWQGPAIVLAGSLGVGVAALSLNGPRDTASAPTLRVAHPPRTEIVPPSPPPPDDRADVLAALEQVRRRELVDAVKKTKAERDACLMTTRTYMAVYELPAVITVAADGAVSLAPPEPTERPAEPVEGRLPGKAEACMRGVFEATRLAPAKHAITLRETLVLE